MPYPVIILGAGASYDYIHHKDEDKTIDNYKPPLIKELFSPRIRGIAKGIISRYVEVKLLFGELNSAVRAGKDFEQHLLKLREVSIERKKQMISFQYYLSDLFQLISDKYRKQIGNNYHTLVGKIRDSFEEACFVSFNYDSLLEQALFPEKAITNLNTYIAGQYKLIKLHGSCDWVYLTPDRVADISSFSRNGLYQHLIHNPDHINTISKHNKIVMRDSKKSDDYPAIAMPIAGKDKESFVCPEEHKQQLTEALSKTDRILIIGWRAGDLPPRTSPPSKLDLGPFQVHSTG